MIRIFVLIASSLLFASASLVGQNSSVDADSAANAQMPGENDGRYVSGLQILDNWHGTDLGHYPIRTLESIRSKWYPQIPELQKSIGRKQGITVIEFEIRRDGSLEKTTTIESAGDASLDSAAGDAISSSAPFARLPDAYHKKTLRLRMSFGYNQPGSAKAPFCDGPNWGAHPAAYVLHKIGGEVTPPKTTYDHEPEYSEQARRDKYMSVVHIAGTVDPQGVFTDVCVSESAGEGLDERAMEAVKTWTFQPATLQGEPVATRINVEMSFQLY